MFLSLKFAFIHILVLFFFKKILCTIDMNTPELQYIADHLTAEECRKLIAAVHFKGFEEPNALDQAERTISKDLPCVELLHHWNSQAGEGKGETHEVLEHRLRQMGKFELADWLGRMVFHELSIDLNRSLEEGLINLATDETTEEVVFVAGPSLAPIIEDIDPTEWTTTDSVLYALAVGLIFTIVALCLKVCCTAVRTEQPSKHNTSIVQFKKPPQYMVLTDETSGSESDRFDVRDHTSNINYDVGEIT